MNSAFKVTAVYCGFSDLDTQEVEIVHHIITAANLKRATERAQQEYQSAASITVESAECMS